MAKITANGNHEIASLNAALSYRDETAEDENVIKWISYRFVLRSDGKILYRLRGENGTSFSIWNAYRPARLRAKGYDLERDGEKLLRKSIKARGYVPVDEIETLTASI